MSNYELPWNGIPFESDLISFDTETNLVDLKRDVPKLALATASDGVRTVILEPSQVERFLVTHHLKHWIFHNASFDFWVLHQHCSGIMLKDTLFDMVESNRFHDTMLLDMLVRLAQGKGETNSDEDEATFFQRDLGELSKEYAPEVQISKEDPYRMRYPSLLGLSQEAFCQADPGFFTYAAKDALATYKVFKELSKNAKDLQEPFLKNGSIYPDSQTLYGLLTEQVQIKAAIALYQITRNGLYIAQEKIKPLEEFYERKIAEGLKWLMNKHPDLFTWMKRLKKFKLKEASQLPCMKHLYLQKEFERFCKEQEFEPQRSEKTKKISTSTKYWKQFEGMDEFIDKWLSVGEHTTVMGFFELFRKNKESIHPSYGVLKRTGRTSAYDPNVQQIPKTKEFRALFCARPGFKLMTIDYAAIELRTLGTVCKRKFGFSKLLEVINEGVDPHANSAAMVKGMKFEEFMDLKHTDIEAFKKDRQAAKACFHPDVEVLTKAGWIKIKDVTMEDKVAQFWPWCNFVDFRNPLALTFRENQKLVRVHNTSIDLRVTEDHRMLGYRQNGAPVVCVPAKMDGTLRGVWNAGRCLDGIRYGALTSREIQKVLCIQADGHVDGNRVRFGFKKERKIERFRSLWPDATPKIKDGVTSFTIEWKPVYETILDKATKTLRMEVILRLPLSQRETFMNEIMYWDSHQDKRGKRFSFCTTVPENANVLQAVAAITGYKTNLRFIKRKKEHHKDVYVVSVKKRDYTRSGSFDLEMLEGLHTVYCLSVPSSFMIVRDAGKVVCVGNCNFGVPGGLGPKKLSAYAKAQYGVSLTEEEAGTFRTKLIREVYPELSDIDGYLADRTLKNLAQNLGLEESFVSDFFEEKFHSFSGAAVYCLQKVLVGETLKKDGSNYSVNWIDQLWSAFKELLQKSKVPQYLYQKVASRTPDRQLVSKLFYETSTTLTGRLRGQVGYTQARNGPFQSLAADGAKLALWRLIKEGFRVVGFIHDEMLIELPEATAQEDSLRAKGIIEEEMFKVLKGAVPIATEFHLGDCWEK